MLWTIQAVLHLLSLYSPKEIERPSSPAQAPLQVQQTCVPCPTTTPSKVPDYFDTTRGWYAGPTQTGAAPYLAQTNGIPFLGSSYIPNTPLETQAPIPQNPANHNIFQRLANLSPYFPNPRGFGVDEFPLPPGANVSWLNMVSRHGSRYPEARGPERKLGEKLMRAKGRFEATGQLEWLNGWEFLLGAEILVPVGKQELFNSGTLHYYQYGHLYPNNGSKIIARTTTQRRMLESAEYFLAGFFGLGWTQNATLVVGIEADGFNNTLAGYKKCKRDNWDGAYNATLTWAHVYLADAHSRIKSMITGDLDWTLEDTYHSQALCAYETIALGFSHWCSLFTYPEWLGFSYSLDIGFSSGIGFLSPVGRATGIGYVVEVVSRMQHHLPTTPPTFQLNTTLTNTTTTFPIHQAINLDFSHDSNIIAILTAFNLSQFAELLPLTHVPESHEFVLAYLEPFAGRLDIEIISAPHPVAPNRGNPELKSVYLDGNETKYVRFALNQRTVPLGKSLSECGERDDGWCELGTFLEVIGRVIEEAGEEWEWACFGDWNSIEYGDVRDGRPPGRREGT